MEMGAATRNENGEAIAEGYQEKLSLKQKYCLLLIVRHPYIHCRRGGDSVRVHGPACRDVSNS
jgi:hypothetical protein